MLLIYVINIGRTGVESSEGPLKSSDFLETRWNEKGWKIVESTVVNGEKEEEKRNHYLSSSAADRRFLTFQHKHRERDTYKQHKRDVGMDIKHFEEKSFEM